MKPQYITSILISLATYLTAYKGGIEPSMAVKAIDAAWLIMSFTIPLALISSMEDIRQNAYSIAGLFVLGTIIFCIFIPFIDPDYDSGKDNFITIAPSALIFLVSAIVLQLILNKVIRLLFE